MTMKNPVQVQGQKKTLTSQVAMVSVGTMASAEVELAVEVQSDLGKKMSKLLKKLWRGILIKVDFNERGFLGK